MAIYGTTTNREFPSHVLKISRRLGRECRNRALSNVIRLLGIKPS